MKENIKKNVSKKLKMLIKEQFKTQKIFAKELNVSERTVSQWIQGEYLPNLDFLLTVADHCNIHISYFFNDDSNASILDEELFNKVFILAYELADEHNLEINGSYFLGCYEMVKSDMLKSQTDCETSFKNNEKLLLKLVKKR